ncbi:MAG TPA: glycosyltransferase [Patescibacteria group bacterium]|nr:glycosyltransferase [Patescibacteria group bacterium]
MKKIALSVVIPCYDEMANLQKGVLDKVAHFLNKKKIMYEVIVVDDGSKDGSVEFLKQFVKDNPNFQLLKGDHYGKAGAVTRGMLEAQGDLVLFTDMDQAVPIEDLDKLLPYFDEGYDVVIGSRGIVRKGAPWTRLLMSRGMIFLRKLIVGLPNINDTQCGFKMFTRNAAQELFSKLTKLHKGFHVIGGSNVAAGFDVELLYLAEKCDYSIKEVPVKWLYVETRRVNPVFDSIEGLRGLFRIRRKALLGVYRNL